MNDEYDDHMHKYYLFSSKPEFEPVSLKVAGATKSQIFYKRNEYAILSCNCSSVIRVKVKE